MIDFKPFEPSLRAEYAKLLTSRGVRGCEYSFTNLYLWGRQKATIIEGNLVFFSQFDRKSVYLFPVGTGDLQKTLEAIIRDAGKRGIPCRLTGLTHDDCALLEQLFPGRFRYHFDRDSFDYVYDINALADLKGKTYQKKRNHLNRFRQNYPDHKLVPLTEENLSQAEALVAQWYKLRLEQNPHSDFHMEQAAINKAFRHWSALGLEGLMLTVEGNPVAMTVGSPLDATTFDIHFEKALDIADGAYPAINQGFAAYLRDKYPQLLWLNREDDMGLEGLRKAKLSYYPDHMQEKHWACLLEDGYDY